MNSSFQNDGTTYLETNKAASENLLSPNQKISAEKIVSSQIDLEKYPKLTHSSLFSFF